MKPLSFMLIAGEASGDWLAAGLVRELKRQVVARSLDCTADAQPLRTALLPEFFGAGGPQMAAAGVELAVDLTRHSVIGITEVLKNLGAFRRLFRQLLALACERQPDVIIGIDYGGFNLRLARAIRRHTRRHHSEFTPWHPRLVQFVSPQVWASRPARAFTLAENHDLLLSIFPFERQWYSRRTPKLRVEFVGHPMIGRSAPPRATQPGSGHNPSVVFLPGSRRDEVRRHLPLIIRTHEIIRATVPGLNARMVFPDAALAEFARATPLPADLTLQVGELTSALATADLAITKSGTVTLECAAAGVPAVVFYKTSWLTYLIARQIISVKYLAMPNLLADAEVYPEFVQAAATPANLAAAALELLRDIPRRNAVRAQLNSIMKSLGGPGATGRAATAILQLLP
jgi:lipid-A-disaccharide synthase